ncbi:MAG: 50S ribosomal protein L11 methyltransferase [Deltaproteobacteria bacterium]|nr:MAG: 50S ribosomal protein L11 methyltransferase [Deltaproteobacteria bacterium]
MTEPEPRYPYVHVDVPADMAEAVSAELWDLGAEGVEERDGGTMSGPAGEAALTLVAFFSDPANAESVAATFQERYPARVEFVVGDAWRDSWREYFEPSRVGARLLIRPSWREVRAFPDEVVLTIDPGRAFGSGIHETTRLVLREVDRRVKPGDHLLDVGSGSGILAVAAVLFGAAHVRTVDNDPDTVPVVLENATLNGVADRIEADATPVGDLTGTYPLVLANIQPVVLIPLARDIADRVAPGGTLILSGILRPQRDEVVAAYPDFDLELTSFEGEWVALVLRRRGEP